MKRILIYRVGAQLKPTGGPSGYLYSLREGLALFNHDDFQIDFLPGSAQSPKTKWIKSKNKNSLLKNLLSIFRVYKHVKFCLGKVYRQKKIPIDVSKYDAIHFHATCDYYEVRDALKNYRGKIILTSHSPQPLSSEFYEGSSQLELFLFKKQYKKMIEFDKYSFINANYVVFPCEFADEPYIHAWPEYLNIKKQRGADTYRYFLSGTVPAKPRLSRIEVRKKYRIPENAFVISYIGRHNEIKGYDRFKRIGLDCLSKYENVYVLVAGNVSPIMPPSHERWIEVGWTNDPHSIVAASDTFVLPNKETYFDLVLLEVLSLGTPVVISNTGGNKYFKNYNLEGIKLFDTEEEAVSEIKSNMQLSLDMISSIMKENIELYNSSFTIEKFARNYVDLISRILKD